MEEQEASSPTRQGKSIVGHWPASSSSDGKNKKRDHRNSLTFFSSPSVTLLSPSNPKQKIKLEHRTMNALEEMEREKNAEAAAAAEQDVRERFSSLFPLFRFRSLRRLAFSCTGRKTKTRLISLFLPSPLPQK